MSKKVHLAILVVVSSFLIPSTSSFAFTPTPHIAEDKNSGYDRSLFKHWIDANKNGCDTRAEVLISEATVKPKTDKKCKISSGKWISAYDGKSVTDASKLDVDHLVPLAEAWRSGAWAWTPQQRQDYANDLTDKRTLIAVTLSTNRSKGDKDISDWVPKIDPCGYVQNWIAVKIRYSLTYDAREAKTLSNYSLICKFTEVSVQALAGYSYQSQPGSDIRPTPSPSPTPIRDLDLIVPTDPVNVQASWLGNDLTVSFDWDYKNPENSTVSNFVLEITGEGATRRTAANELVPNRNQTSQTLTLTKKLNELIFGNFTVAISSVCVLAIDPYSNYSRTVCAPEIPKYVLNLPVPEITVTPITPGSFCSPAGAIGKSSNGTLYTCKTSSTDSRNRWRQ